MPARALAVTRAAGTAVPVYACVPMEEQTPLSAHWLKAPLTMPLP